MYQGRNQFNYSLNYHLNDTQTTIRQQLTNTNKNDKKENNDKDIYYSKNSIELKIVNFTLGKIQKIFQD